MRHTLPAAALVCATVVALAGVPPAGAAISPVRTAATQTAPGATKATCADVLTDDEVAAAVGRRGATSEKKDNNELGSSQCRWLWSDTESSVTVNYTNAAGISARAATTRCCADQSRSPSAQFFDYAIRMDVDLGSEPPAALTGIGERAALFFEEAFLKLVVQRPDGVASIVGANISREQMLALAKAIAAP